MLYRRASWAVCATLLIVACTSAAPLPPENLLRFQIKKGEKLRYVLEEKGVMHVGVNKIESILILDLGWEAIAVGADGKITIVQTIDRLQLSGSGGGMKLGYDSQAVKEPEDPVSKKIAASVNIFVGAKVTLVLSPRGHVESLKFSEKLTGALAKMPPDAVAIASALSEDSLRRMVGQCLPALPENVPVKGGAWTSTLQAKFAGAVNFVLDNKHTFEGEEKRGGRTVVRIVNKPTLTVKSDPGARFAIKTVSQDVNSTAYFDRAQGRLIESVYAQKVEMEVTEDGQKTTITGDTVTTLKLVGNSGK